MAELSLSRSQLLLLAGTANRPLAEEMAGHLGQPLCALTIRRFADGEIFVKIDENVRGRDVFIIQPTNPPAETLVELLLMIDAARRASAARITAVLPYFGYARQDRKDQPRVAISAKLMANLITHAGADRVLGMDFHSHQVQGFFDIPVDHLYAAPVFVAHFRQKRLHDPVVVAPDVGSAKMARGFAKRLNASLAIIDKRRPSANVAEVVNVVGEVADKDCLVPDDMIDTAGTVTEAAAALKRLGARKIYAVIYGRGRETQSLAVEAKALEKALTGVEPASTIIELAVDGKTVRTLIREIQRHPVRPDIIHVDFYEIHAAEKVKLKVPVHLVGAPDGVRNAGGVLDQVTREVEIEVLPEQIPDRVELDVTALKIGDSLHVRNLQIPNVTILTHSDLTIATVVPPRAEEVTAPTPEAVAEVAEPELIRKVREGEEEAEGEAAEGGPKPEVKGAAAPAKGAAPPAKGEKGEKPEKTEKPKGGKES